MRLIKVVHNPVIAWLILGISVVLTFSAYHISNNVVKERAEERFEFRVKEIETAIADRLHIYEQVLWSGVGLMYASEEVTRDGFAKFVETLNLDKHWPGIQGMGFSVPVKPEDKQEHIESIRSEGFLDFVIKPEGERDLYSSIIYLEPFDWRNKRAFGYDMWSNPMRRDAMTRARDEGVAATSGIITLVQETGSDIQPGFLTYVPTYKTKNIPKTVQERRKQFSGWIYAPYRAGNLMRGVRGSQDSTIEFEVFDADVMHEDNLLFDSNDSLHLNEANHDPDFSRVIRMTNQGREWTLYCNTPPSYLSGSEANQPRLVAIAGVVIDMLLFYVIWVFYFINKRAESIAKKMTKEVNQSNQKLEERVKERTEELQMTRKSLEDRVFERTKDLDHKIKQLEDSQAQLERMNKSMVGRELKMKALKQKITDLEGKTKR